MIFPDEYNRMVLDRIYCKAYQAESKKWRTEFFYRPPNGNQEPIAMDAILSPNWRVNLVKDIKKEAKNMEFFKGDSFNKFFAKQETYCYEKESKFYIGYTGTQHGSNKFQMTLTKDEFESLITLLKDVYSESCAVQHSKNLERI